MKIIVKTVKNVIGEFEVQPEMTILELKQQIADKEGLTPDCLSLILKSKMLKDDKQTIADVNMHDGDNVVIVIKKAAAPKPAAPKPAEQPAPQAAPAPAPQPTQPVQQPAAQTQPTQDAVNIFQQPAPQQAPVVAEPSDENIALVCGMGFTREQAVKALKKANNSAELAVNFLLEGVDLDRLPDPGQRQAAPQGPAGGMGAMGLGTKEEFLEDVRQHPEAYEAIFHDLEKSNPMIGQLARNNPGMLYDILVQSMQAQGGMPQGGMPQQPAYHNPPQAAPQPQQQARIALSPEDQEAVARLEQLGFTKQQALQAYIACDKNEMLAANFLLDGGMF